MDFYVSPFRNTQEEYAQILDFMSLVYGQTRQLDDFPRARFEIWCYEHFLQDEESGFFPKNCHLWKADQDELAGVFISEDGESAVHLISHPGYPELTHTMLAWVFEVWAAERDELWTELSTCKTREIALYTQHGFTRSETYAVTRRYDLADLNLQWELPEGFSVTSAGEDVDIAGHVALIKDAFGKEFYEEAVYQRLRNALSYSADLDITVYSPENKAVATCTGWVDTMNNVAEIETVGTHSKYRRRGLARVAMTVCLERLQRKGYTSAFISSLNDITHAFYDSFPFEGRDVGFEYHWKRAQSRGD